MKQFLKSIFSIALLVSSASAFARDCGSATNCSSTCDTKCDLSACTTNFNCNDRCNDRCSDRCSRSNDCSFSCSDSCSDNCDSCFTGRTGFHYRSQGANTARELVGWQWEINRPCMCDNYGAAYLAFEYTRTFKSRHLAKRLFGNDVLRFEGSLVPNRSPFALVADNFGLSRHFQGSIAFRPRIENYIVDFGLYLGLDCWCPGMYFRLHAPFVHTRWRLDNRCNDCCDVVCTTTGNVPFDPCYVSSTAATGAATLDGRPVSTCVTGAPVTGFGCNTLTTDGGLCPTIESALSGTCLFGDMKTPWSAGRFDFCRRTRNGLADIDLIFGYNWLNDDCYHFGAYIQAVLPTGRKKRNLFVFDPVVGNGGHFELGAGISAHSVLWSCEDANLAVFLEGNVTHMFKSRQCRLFDFCREGFLSRYLLLKEFTTDGQNLVYNGNLVSATNFNNRRVDVRIDVKGDASVKLAYRWCGFGFDLGYNIYGHSHEKIRFRCEDQGCDDNRKFGIKGTTSVCCFNFPVVERATFPTEGPGIVAPCTPTILSLPGGGVQAPVGPNPDAPRCPALTTPTTVVTVLPNSCTAPVGTTAFNAPQANVTVPAEACTICFDSRSCSALSGVPSNPVTPLSELTPANGFYVAGFTNGANGVGSCTPNLVSANDLNPRSAEAPSTLTHKVFAHLDYVWMDECGWNPHLGVGGEAEFEGNRKGNDCARGGVNQWGVWVKGSLSF